ncbi:MAG: hypothetical protein AUI50_03095 [Crenarchaeota archaeon 13_1_40CM_2_52_14]|nr:MAG: hypothetical protein AUI50_03095 [Crenarchaeota archaeon 13_1_40CM_2_52_14]
MGHSVLCLALSNLCPDYDHIFLGDSDRLVTPRTEVIAQLEPSTDRMVFGARPLFSNVGASDPWNA